MVKFKKLRLAAAGIIAALASSNLVAQEYDYFAGEHQAFQQSSDKVVATYVTSWANVDSVRNMPGDNLSHIIYAFLRTCGPNELAQDAAVCANKADFQLNEDATSKDKLFAPVFAELKAQYPHLKFLPSVGGWGGSGTFPVLADTAESRSVFIQSVVDYLSANPAFDGIDIDWEWPTTIEQGEDYASLMVEMRAAFDQLTQQTGRQYLITSAVGTNNHLNKINFDKAIPAMDYIFMMSYDFFGGWSINNIGHHAALLAHQANSRPDAATIPSMYAFIDAGVPADKLVMGVAKYARGWDGVSRHASGSEIGGKGTGLFPKKVNSWDEEGVAVYTQLSKDIIGADGNGINGFEVKYDAGCECHYAWRESDGAFVGFDHPLDVERKGQYVLANNLAGIFSWQYSQDNGDILNAMNKGVGNALAGQVTETESQTETQTETNTNTVTDTETLTDTGTCNSVEHSYQVYPDFPRLDWAGNPNHANQGDMIIHKGYLWQANWWTKSEPSSSDASWHQLEPLDNCSTNTATGTDTDTVSETATETDTDTVSETVTETEMETETRTATETVTETETLTETDTDSDVCDSPVYQAGTAYQANSLVNNQDKEYICSVSGWCSSDASWAYEPGEGLYWQTAWQFKRDCQ